MLRLKKKPTRREQARNIRDDLSILTAGLPITKVGGRRTSGWRAPVSKQDIKLKQQFDQARAEAYFRVGERPPVTIPIPISNPNLALTSSPKPNPNPIPSTIPQVQRELPKTGHCTIGCVPPFVTSSDVRAHLQQQKSQASSTFGRNGQPPVIQQSTYWTSHVNRRQQPKTATTVFNSKIQVDTTASSWKITSSMPINRKNAAIVQQTMADYMNPGILPLERARSSQSWVPSLAKGIVPPPSPIVQGGAHLPPTPASFHSGGVYQSEWIDRSNKKMKEEPWTKQYSIQQLVDVVCGFVPPDSRIAQNLYDPCPSEPTAVASTSTATESNIFRRPEPPKKSVQKPSTTVEERKENVYNAEECNFGETSIYFEQPKPVSNSKPRKKQVTFLTDTQDNIKAHEFVFDAFSEPENPFRTVPSAAADPPSPVASLSFLDNLTSAPSPSNQQINAQLNTLLFGSEFQSSQTGSLPELSGTLFSGVSDTAAAAVGNYLFPDLNTPPNLFQLGENHSIGLLQQNKEPGVPAMQRSQEFSFYDLTNLANSQLESQKEDSSWNQFMKTFSIGNNPFKK